MAKTPLLLFNWSKYVFMSIGFLLLACLITITIYNKIRAKNRNDDNVDEQQGPRLDVNETTPLLIE